MSQLDLTAQLRGHGRSPRRSCASSSRASRPQAAPEPRPRRASPGAGRSWSPCRLLPLAVGAAIAPSRRRSQQPERARAGDPPPAGVVPRRARARRAAEHGLREGAIRPPIGRDPGRAPTRVQRDQHDPRAARHERRRRLRRHEAGRRDRPRPRRLRLGAQRRCRSSAPATRTSSSASRSRTCRRPSTASRRSGRSSARTSRSRTSSPGRRDHPQDRAARGAARRLAGSRRRRPRPQAHIAALTDQIASSAAAATRPIRNASFATVRLELTTREAPAPVHHGNGPLHDLAVAFRWIGIGAVYALALGAPLLILFGLAWLGVRTVRRHRENALLSRS